MKRVFNPLFITLLLLSSSLQAAEYKALNPQRLQKHLELYAPYELKYNESQLTPGEKSLLKKLVEVGHLVDRLYLSQLDPNGWQTFEAIKAQYEQKPNVGNQRLLEYFWINKGPFDQLAEEAYSPFMVGAPKFHPARNYYPADMTVEEFEKWVASLPAKEAALARSDFSVIRRDAKGKLAAIPYSQAYQAELEPLAALLESAAQDVPGTSLAEFLKVRAQAFRTNNLEKSEALWIDMNGVKDQKASHIDITVGAYENYSDELMKRKAAYEFYAGVLQPEKTAALQLYSKHVHAMDKVLWEKLQAHYKSGTEVAPGKKLPSDFKPSRWSPPGDKITLVAMDLAYSGGMANEGKQTLAYNLPNVESWTEKYGTKKVMMINVIEGKFNLILKPIAKMVLNANELPNIDSGMFSDNTVRHEVAHGIGPSTIKVDGKTTTVRERLQKSHSAFEEAKAEIVSLLFGYHLADSGAISKDPAVVESFKKRMAANYVVSAFRTIRFGVTSDHAKGKLFEFNRLMQNGAIAYQDGHYSINYGRFPEAVEKLAMEILDLQMRGTVETATAMLDTVGSPTPALTRLLAQIDGPGRREKIPVDLRVSFNVEGSRNYSVIRASR